MKSLTDFGLSIGEGLFDIGSKILRLKEIPFSVDSEHELASFYEQLEQIAENIAEKDSSEIPPQTKGRIAFFSGIVELNAAFYAAGKRGISKKAFIKLPEQWQNLFLYEDFLRKAPYTESFRDARSRSLEIINSKI